MIDREYTIKFIDKLIELTSKRQITWMTLPRYFETNENEPLRRIVIANNEYAYTPMEAKNTYLINEYRSYCTVLNGGVITLFSKNRGKDVRLDISIQVEPTHHMTDLYYDDDIKERLGELMVQISMKTDDGLRFITEILNL